MIKPTEKSLGKVLSVSLIANSLINDQVIRTIAISTGFKETRAGFEKTRINQNRKTK